MASVSYFRQPAKMSFLTCVALTQGLR